MLENQKSRILGMVGVECVCKYLMFPDFLVSDKRFWGRLEHLSWLSNISMITARADPFKTVFSRLFWCQNLLSIFFSFSKSPTRIYVQGLREPKINPMQKSAGAPCPSLLVQKRLIDIFHFQKIILSQN